MYACGHGDSFQAAAMMALENAEALETTEEGRRRITSGFVRDLKTFRIKLTTPERKTAPIR